MRTVFIILPQQHAHLTAADELEHMLRFMLVRREVQHSSRSYYDEFAEYEIEYGVRMDISEPFCDEHFQRLLGEIVVVTAQLYGSIRIQLGDKCVTT